MVSQVEDKPVNTSHVSKVVNLWLRILKVHLAHPELILMKMWKNNQ